MCDMGDCNVLQGGGVGAAGDGFWAQPELLATDFVGGGE